MKKVDDYTVQFTTTDPSPYFPSKALYVRPLSKAAFEKYGEYYNNTPETTVSSSPWILTEWTKGKQMVFGPNTNYTGKLKPYIEKLIITFGDYSNDFPRLPEQRNRYGPTSRPRISSLIIERSQR